MLQRRCSHMIDLCRLYLPLMRSCLTNSLVAGSGNELDHRYFFLELNGRGRYTCGLARQAMNEFFRECAEDGMFLTRE
jgi:hypothetical protein